MYYISLPVGKLLNLQDKNRLWNSNTLIEKASGILKMATFLLSLIQRDHADKETRLHDTLKKSSMMQFSLRRDFKLNTYLCTSLTFSAANILNYPYVVQTKCGGCKKRL